MTVKVPRALFEMEEKVMKTKATIQRLEKGASMLEKAVANRSMSESLELAKLFTKIAKGLVTDLEDAAFMHEFLVTGRTTVIDRFGRAVTGVPFNPNEHRVVDLFTMRSIEQLSGLFGPESIIEFETESE